VDDARGQSGVSSAVVVLDSATAPVLETVLTRVVGIDNLICRRGRLVARQ
jgi:hypothetical protein